MALSHFLSHLTNPQVAFAVRQQRPKKLEEAVCATLEIESYLLKPAVVGNITPEVDEYMVGAIGSGSGATGSMPQSSEQTLMRAFDQLTQRLSQLEEGVVEQKFSGQQGNRIRLPNQPRPRDQTPTVTCYRCGKEGHYARGCALHRPSRQGTRNPPCRWPGREG